MNASRNRGTRVAPDCFGDRYAVTMARPASIDDTALIDLLSQVISRHGFEGASLQLLSKASGLKRASLYHRFPGGKAEILEAVLSRAEERFGIMLAPALETGDAVGRAERIATEVDRYYDGGRESCLIVALSLADEEQREMAAPCLEAWTGAFAKISRDAGLSRRVADERAHELVAQIEGALVVASTTGDRTSFANVIQKLPDRLVGTS